MAITRGTRKIIDNFDRPLTLTTTPEGGNGGFGWAIVAAGTTPTYATTGEDGGAMVISLTATNEVQTVCMYAKDILMFDLAKIQHYWVIAKVATVASLSVVTIGLGSAYAADEDTVATNAWFKMEGATSTTAVVAETDDAVTDNNDVATGCTLAAVYKKFHIDFTNGLADVRFNIDGAPVARGTTFDMSGLTSGLNVQPYIQVTKASSTNTPILTLAQVGIQYEWAYGA